MNETKNIIIGAVLSIAILVGVVWVAQTSSKDKQLANISSVAATKLEAKEMAYDFGSISMANGKVSHLFSVKNPGTASVNVSRLYTSCMCTAASIIQGGKKIGPFGMAGHGFVPKADVELAAGEEVELEVVFDPNAHGPAGVGPISRAIYLEDASGSSLLEIGISGTVTP